MRAITRTIHYHSRSDVFTLVPLFDLHLGNAACDEALLRRTVEDIKKGQNHLWLGGGDMADFINRSDKRHRESAVASWLWGVDDIAIRSRDKVVDVLSPIKDKCIGLLKGNHEDSFLRHYEVDVYASLVEKLRGPDKIMLGWQGFVVLRFLRVSENSKGGTWYVRIYCHHGYGGGRLEGGHALTLGRVFKDYDCDLALLGHRHVKYPLPRVQVAVSTRGNVYKRQQLGLFCGSFLESYSEDEVYAEAKGLPALPLGPPKIHLYPGSKKIEVTV